MVPTLFTSTVPTARAQDLSIAWSAVCVRAYEHRIVSLSAHHQPDGRPPLVFALILDKDSKSSVVMCVSQILTANVWRSWGSNSGPKSLSRVLQNTGPECLSPLRAHRESTQRIRETYPPGRRQSSCCSPDSRLPRRAERPWGPRTRASDPRRRQLC